MARGPHPQAALRSLTLAAVAVLADALASNEVSVRLRAASVVLRSVGIGAPQHLGAPLGLQTASAIEEEWERARRAAAESAMLDATFASLMPDLRALVGPGVAGR